MKELLVGFPGRSNKLKFTELCHLFSFKDPCLTHYSYTGTLPGRTVSGSNSGRGKIFFSSSKRPERLQGPRILPFNHNRNSFLEVKLPEREDKHSPRNSTQVKNKWSYTSTCFHGVGRENFPAHFQRNLRIFWRFSNRASQYNLSN